MTEEKMIIVFLRQPKRDREERRDDPFWEFGSFGCTGCHKRNLLNPKRSGELDGVRFAFVQGGAKGVRLVYVTPPVKIHAVGKYCEAVWSPIEMPLTYSTAPLVVDNEGQTDLPELASMVGRVNRSTPVGQFSSAFRTRRTPIAGEVAAQVQSTYDRFRKGLGEISSKYFEAMPYPPPKIEQDRAARYQLILSKAQAEVAEQA